MIYTEACKDKNVLITGISGFIGSALAKDLHECGANVYGVVKELGAISNLDVTKVTLILSDVCSYKDMCWAMSYYEIDVVYHLAAYAIVRSSAKDPMSTYSVNVMGTVNVLEAARSVGKPPRVIVASSDKAYGDHDVLPYKEDFGLKPKNTYDSSKACMDIISRSYGSNYDMEVIVTRCSNVYGPGDMNISRIVPNTIKRICDGKAPLVYSDVENMEREFIYIDDVVDAYLRLGFMHDLTHDVYNIGGTGPVKIYDLISSISKLMCSSKKPTIVQRDPTFKEIQKQYIDATRLEADTNWCVSHKLSRGLVKSINWYRHYYTTGERK